MLEPTIPPPTMTTSAVCMILVRGTEFCILAEAVHRSSGARFARWTDECVRPYMVPSWSKGHVPLAPALRGVLNPPSTSVTCRGYCTCLVWNSMALRCLVFSSHEEMVQPIWQVLTDLGIEESTARAQWTQ